MNTPTPTEAHTDLVESVVYSNARSAALQIAESEARAIAAAVTTLTCTHHNDQQRAACPVCLVTTLTTERDQLRADCENETKWAAHYLAQSIADKARAERAEAALHAATEECTDVRLKWHAVMGTCAAKEDAIIESDEELARLRAEVEAANKHCDILKESNSRACAEVERLKDGGVQRIKDALATTLDERAAAIARAKRAEAEVERLKTGGIVELAAVNSSVLEYCKHWEARAERAEAELATERARLDYLLKWDVTFNSRKDIDRDMQEAAK